MSLLSRLTHSHFYLNAKCTQIWDERTYFILPSNDWDLCAKQPKKSSQLPFLPSFSRAVLLSATNEERLLLEYLIVFISSILLRSHSQLDNTLRHFKKCRQNGNTNMLSTRCICAFPVWKLARTVTPTLLF